MNPNPVIWFLVPLFLWGVSLVLGAWGFGHHNGRGFLAVLAALVISLIATIMFLDGGLLLIL